MPDLDPEAHQGAKFTNTQDAQLNTPGEWANFQARKTTVLVRSYD
jgi:hypothetical protein